MKARIFGLMLVSVFFVLICCNCGVKQDEQNAFSSDFDFAVIEASDTKEHSIITYYDKDFRILCTQSIDYGNLSDIYKPGIVKKENLYLSPDGKSPHTAHSVVAIDLADGKKTEYTFGKDETQMMGMDVNGDNLYVCSNLNGASTVSCSSLRKKDIVSKKLPDVVIDELCASDNVLYAFGLDMEEENYDLYELDAKTLEVLHKTDLESPVGAVDSMMYGKKLYFTVAADQANYVRSKNRLGCYDPRKKKVRWFDFSEQKSMGNIVESNGLLFIAHTERPLGVGRTVTVFDPIRESKKTFKFDDLVSQIEARGNDFYILSCYSGDGKAKVYKYTYGEDGFKKLGSVNVFTQEKNEKQDYYVGSLLVNREESENENKNE